MDTPLLLSLKPSHFLSTLFGLLAFAPFAYALFNVIYNAFFHPLRVYPGPKLNAISQIPWLRVLVGGGAAHEISKLHDKYGHIVRISPNQLSFQTVEAWKEIMGHRKGGQAEMEKDLQSHFPRTFNAQNIINSDHDVHTRMRRVLSRGFSEKAMREQEPLINGYVKLLIENLRKRSGEKANPVNLVSWYNFTTFDIIGDLAFGEPFDCLKNSNYHPWVSMIFSSSQYGTYISALRRYPFADLFLRYIIPRRQMAAFNQTQSLTAEKVDKRLSQDTDRPDFISKILEQKSEMSMTRNEITSNAGLLIVAGSETTATALSGVTYYLLQNPDCLQKLTEEVRSTFTDESEINLHSVGHLSYMLACLEEGLRMYPPVPGSFPRLVGRGGGIIDGRHVPEGTSVAIYQRAMYRSAKFFNDPDTFHPERFLGDPKFATDRKDALQPFHTGPRNCIGRNLAIAEMRLILAKVIYNFDMKMDPSCNGWDNQRAYIFWEKGPLNVHLTPAVHASA